jgi:hypothetical protein
MEVGNILSERDCLSQSPSFFQGRDIYFATYDQDSRSFIVAGQQALGFTCKLVVSETCRNVEEDDTFLQVGVGVLA